MERTLRQAKFVFDKDKLDDALLQFDGMIKDILCVVFFFVMAFIPSWFSYYLWQNYIKNPIDGIGFPIEITIVALAMILGFWIMTWILGFRIKFGHVPTDIPKKLLEKLLFLSGPFFFFYCILLEFTDVASGIFHSFVETETPRKADGD
jgi:ABC-type multidrug transport system fused ATPase/permease subunit